MPIRSCIRPIDELLSNCGPPHRKNVRFADSTTVAPNFHAGMTTTNQTSPTHPRAWRIKRSKPIPETTPTTPLTLIPSQRSENSKRNKKVVGTKTVKFSFIERAILPNGQVMESVICFNAPNEYWKPGALEDKPWYIMNCRTTRYTLKLLFFSSSTVVII